MGCFFKIQKFYTITQKNWKIQKRTRDLLNDRLKRLQIIDSKRIIGELANAALGIYNDIENPIRNSQEKKYEGDPGDPGIPRIGLSDQLSCSQLGFIKRDKYLTSRSFLKFDFNQVIKRTWFHQLNFDLINEIYMNFPLIRKNYVWFNYSLEQCIENVQSDYYYCYINRGDQNEVNLEKLHKFVKSDEIEKNRVDWNFLQKIIHKYHLSEHAFAIKWLARYGMSIKIEELYGLIIEKDIKIYYD